MSSATIGNTMTTAPKLLKKRQKHSRWFALLAVLLMMVTESSMALMHSMWYEAMESLGAVLIGICILGRSYCSAYIGGVKNDVLMREGPFSIVRNPLYVFSFLGLLGIGMFSGMLTVTLFLAVAFTVYYKFVVAREEAFLLNKFGESYQRYLNEVPRWWPKWSLWSEPQELVVRPKFMRRTMQDAMIFFLPFPCFELLNILHDYGVLPVLFVLP
jgi:protein-S-isoprenylcysteine O-methyltransferase Ste14